MTDSSDAIDAADDATATFDIYFDAAHLDTTDPTDADDSTGTWDSGGSDGVTIDGDDPDVADAAPECVSDFDCAQLYKGQSPCSFYTCDGVSKQCKHQLPKKGEACQIFGQTLSSCQASVCDGQGTCVIQNGADGVHCGFGKCGNKCASGSCVAAAAADYDDGNPCTQDYCDQGKEVVHKAIADLSLSCDDGDVCTEGDACIGGKCLGSPKSCDDGFGCTFDVCDKAKGCVHSPKPGVCDDGDPCSKDACDPAVGCTVTGDVIGASCDDGNACTKDEICGPGGACAGGTPTCACKVDADCANSDLCRPTACLAGFCQVEAAKAVTCTDAGDTVCAKNTCDPTSGVCKPAAAKDGLECDDGDQCTVTSSCAKGACTGSKTKDCDDSNPCTNDVCAAGQGCVSLPNTAACDDGQVCTEGDVCQGGSCAAKAKTCDDNLNCTFDACDEKTGVCSHKADDAKCDDGSACTTDSCGSKGCEYGPNAAGQCDDGDACTANACKGGTCAVTEFVCGCKDAQACDDGNPCTVNSCVAGKCSAKAASDGGTCSTADKCQTVGSGSGRHHVRCGWRRLHGGGRLQRRKMRGG